MWCAVDQWASLLVCSPIHRPFGDSVLCHTANYWYTKATTFQHFNLFKELSSIHQISIHMVIAADVDSFVVVGIIVNAQCTNELSLNDGIVSQCMPIRFPRKILKILDRSLVLGIILVKRDARAIGFLLTGT